VFTAQYALSPYIKQTRFVFVRVNCYYMGGQVGPRAGVDSLEKKKIYLSLLGMEFYSSFFRPVPWSLYPARTLVSNPARTLVSNPARTLVSNPASTLVTISGPYPGL
jgi:hypothetical protein